MNRLQFQRETGAISNGTFARAVTHWALHELELWPWVKFDGGEKAPVLQGVGSSRQQTVDELFIDPDLEDPSEAERRAKDDNVWACQAGVNAVDIDPAENRL